MPNAEKVELLPDKDIQPIPPNQDWGFNRHGLIVSVARIRFYQHYAFKDIPEETIIGIMHFTPAGDTFIPRMRSFVLAEGVAGLDAFFEELDRHNLKPTYLVGRADERMAKLAASIGFKLISDPRDKNLFSVVGETEIVRREFIARKERSRLERLSVRANRQPKL